MLLKVSKGKKLASPVQHKSNSIQRPDCAPFFIARLPVVDDKHGMIIDGKSYNRWGFATALIAWTVLLEESDENSSIVTVSRVNGKQSFAGSDTKYMC